MPTSRKRKKAVKKQRRQAKGAKKHMKNVFEKQIEKVRNTYKAVQELKAHKKNTSYFDDLLNEEE